MQHRWHKGLLAGLAAVVWIALSAVPAAAAEFKLDPAFAPPPGTPVNGGVLREIWSSGPRVLSYYPEMGPMDENGVVPATEKLMQYGVDRELHPFLAESVTISHDFKSITFKIRKGIKFTDGSDLNAEAVAWNYQRGRDTGKLQFKDKLKSIEVVDEHTMVLHVSDYDNQMLGSFGWVPLFSKAAWDKAGPTDNERKVWARANVVGTGPFILKEYQVDHHMTWVKNPTYWQPGKPYLDGIEIRYIPDPVTASAMLQNNEADMWTSGSNIENQADLVKKGFQLQAGGGLPITLYFNNVDPKSPFTNQKVREAAEHAIDKAAIAKALGRGYFKPLCTSAGEDMWGYDPKYPCRDYDPEKARQLLAEAGYPKGLDVTLTTLLGWGDQAQALKQYLDEAGIRVNIDMADPGRFFSMMWGGGGWPHMLLFLQAWAPNSLVCLHRTFGPQPITPMASFVQPKPLIDLYYKARLPNSQQEKKEMARQLVNAFSDECLLVPLWQRPDQFILRPYVHTTLYKESVVMRHYQHEWMDKK